MIDFLKTFDPMTPFGWILGLLIMILMFYGFYRFITEASNAYFGDFVRRAGYNKNWHWLIYVPVVNVIAIWIFAFAEWPNLKKKVS